MIRRVLLCWFAALLAGLLCVPGAVKASERPEWTSFRMIAHAMGGIGGVGYTNSYEAFVVNYEKGHRVFEADLILTGDEKLAARHDWMPYMAEMFGQQLPEDRLGEALDLREFKNAKILDKYKPLSFRDIVKLMQQYPDVYLVTDTKETDSDLVSMQFRYIVETALELDPSVLNRIVPEIYTQDMYATVMDIYPFPNRLYSLYLSDEPAEETLRFVRERQISTVAMPVERARMMPELVAMLRQEGVLVYVHTVNDANELQEMLELGVYGVYTDFLTNRSKYFAAEQQAAGEQPAAREQRQWEFPESGSPAAGGGMLNGYLIILVIATVIFLRQRERLGRLR